MPRIPPPDGPFEHNFRFRARSQSGPFQHGSEPQADREEQLLSHLSRQARIESMPALHTIVVRLLSQGRKPREISEMLDIPLAAVRSVREWCKNDLPPNPPPDEPESGSADLIL